ncbi:transglycosylase domain-containing protein [Bradyrhizobium sp. 142]|nr:transglycosylase domain-containing protein [Bradyrhizobium sp. 142]
MIVANPVFQKTGDQDWSEGADPTLCLPECRTGLTSACATYSSISVKELPDVLVKATLATGDRRFYNHFGIDLTAIALSLHAGPGTKAVRSSITQQVARILFPQMNQLWRSGFRRRLSQFGSNGGSARMKS